MVRLSTVEAHTWLVNRHLRLQALPVPQLADARKVDAQVHTRVEVVHHIREACRLCGVHLGSGRSGRGHGGKDAHAQRE